MNSDSLETYLNTLLGVRSSEEAPLEATLSVLPSVSQSHYKNHFPSFSLYIVYSM